MDILITGGAGFIGSSLSYQLLKNGNSVTALDNFNAYYDPRFKRENIKGFLLNNRFSLQEGDLTDSKFLKSVFANEKFSKVIHLAALVGVRNSLMHPRLYYKSNVEGTRMLLDEVVKHKVSQFIFASSSSVYGNNSPIPFREDAVADSPLSPYAHTKKEAEMLCKTYHETYGIPMTIFRFFTVYGPKGRPDMSPYIFTESILKGKKITVFGDGSARRDFTFVGDIIDGIILGMKKKCPFEVFNLGASSPMDMLSFIRLIEKLTGKKAKLVFAPPVPSEMKHTYANIEKVKQSLGYKPGVSIEEGLDIFVRWFKKNRI